VGIAEFPPAVAPFRHGGEIAAVGDPTAVGGDPQLGHELAITARSGVSGSTRRSSPQRSSMDLTVRVRSSMPRAADVALENTSCPSAAMKNEALAEK
jgi:hypothetical protein